MYPIWIAGICVILAGLAIPVLRRISRGLRKSHDEAQRKKRVTPVLPSGSHEFDFATNDEFLAFAREIAERMQVIFAISREEAQQRISRQWRGRVFNDPYDVVYHEDADYWAKTIYYGPEVHWWRPEAKLIAKPM